MNDDNNEDEAAALRSSTAKLGKALANGELFGPLTWKNAYQLHRWLAAKSIVEYGGTKGQIRALVAHMPKKEALDLLASLAGEMMAESWEYEPCASDADEGPEE